MIAGGLDLNAQSDGWSPAMQSCGDGQLKALRLLIAAGADLDAPGEDGMTPLMVAVLNGEETCLAALLKAGVDVEKKDDTNRTAGNYAVAYKHMECLARLLKAGVDLDACALPAMSSECFDALGAERARRESVALAKSTRVKKSAGGGSPKRPGL